MSDNCTLIFFGLLLLSWTIRNSYRKNRIELGSSRFWELVAKAQEPIVLVTMGGLFPGGSAIFSLGTASFFIPGHAPKSYRLEFLSSRPARRKISLDLRFLTLFVSGSWWSIADRQPPGISALMNSLFAIAPYKFEDMWVFDDERAGLDKEPFVSGADVFLDLLTQDIPNAGPGFKLVFSAKPFPGYSARFIWNREEYEGNWYTWPERQMEGWLCPALFHYFEKAPVEIYVKVSAR